MLRGGSRHANVARVLEVVISHVVDMGVDPPPPVDVLTPLGIRAVIEEVDEDALELHLGAPLAGVGEDGEVEVHRAIFARVAARGMGDRESDLGGAEDDQEHGDQGSGGEGCQERGKDVGPCAPCYAWISHTRSDSDVLARWNGS